MTYKETTEYLFTRTPLFQNVGKDAYKEGFYNTIALDKHFGHPHTKYKTIHVAGTNGKGSCSHTISSILQEAGYKVGLFTSPHLIDFRERIRINGEMIPEQYVVDFVEEEKSFFEPLHPSFFEVTTAMAFKYFADNEVDVAVIEVGLGGRLDCTNIITPIVSIITNISFDHVQFLGNTLDKIAQEKAGIIKENIPVVVGEYTKETKEVFEAKAIEMHSPIVFAQDTDEILSHQYSKEGNIYYQSRTYGTIIGELSGACQVLNTCTIINAMNIICKVMEVGTDNVADGFKHVSANTGLMGRWQKLSDIPLTYCDTGHNIGGFEHISRQLKEQECDTMRIVFGMVNDKDISGVLSLLPTDAVYYFCQASVKRALPHDEIKAIASTFNLNGSSYPTVIEAYQAAKADAKDSDFIYIGGSSFVVADLLSSFA